MVANITSGSNFFGVANYNQQKVDKGQGKVLDSKGFINTHPTTVAYTLNNYNNSRTKKPVFHVSLSFSERDKHLLNDKKLVELTKEYLDKMGYGKQPYVIYRHDDTKHPHVHVVTTRVDTKVGKRLPTYKEGIRSKAITDSLETKHGLTVADNRASQIKTHIDNQVSTAIYKYKPESIKGLNKALAEMQSDVRAKSVKSGTVYYRVDKEGKRQAGTYKSSQFKGSLITHKEVQKQFQKHYQDRQEAKAIVQSSLAQKGKISKKDWLEKLEAKNVKPILHQGEKGIYGVSFTYKDHIYKGSTLDRNLSFGNIKKQVDFSPTFEEKTASLRENLSESIVLGATIEMEYKDHKTYFESTNPHLHEQLNALPEDQARDLVQLHNEYQDRIYHDPLMTDRALIKALAGDEIEEYLRQQSLLLKHRPKQQSRGRGLSM